MSSLIILVWTNSVLPRFFLVYLCIKTAIRENFSIFFFLRCFYLLVLFTILFLRKETLIIKNTIYAFIIVFNVKSTWSGKGLKDKKLYTTESKPSFDKSLLSKNEHMTIEPMIYSANNVYLYARPKMYQYLNLKDK